MISTMMRYFSFVPVLGMLIFMSSFTALAQTDSPAEDNDLASLLAAPEQNERLPVVATFKATRIINGHSMENMARGVLDFRVGHRFGVVNNGLKDFFGLDAANTLIGFDYGITDGLMVGLHRSTFEKELGGYAKVKILRQTQKDEVPFSLSYMGGISLQTMPEPTLLPVILPDGDTLFPEYHFSNRLYFVNQLILARKISPSISLQLTPTHIHYNLVPTRDEPNDLFALGLGGRWKLSNRVSLTAEYFYRFNKLEGYHNGLGIGLDVETGGHVFQLMLTNSTAMTERSFVGQNRDAWQDGGIHFGFNISRVFTLVKPKGFDASRSW